MKNTHPAWGGTEATKPALVSSAPSQAPKTRTILALLFLSGVAGAGASSWIAQAALASRNNSGVMSLAAGNPVSTGTTITSSWANGTLSDIASEITNSLDRNGRGAMAAALQLFDGVVSAPGMTFGSETNTGFYRAGSHDARVSVNGADVQKWGSNSVTLSSPTTASSTLSCTGAVTMADGLSVTRSTSNSVAITGTGSGNEKGGSFIGGSGGGDGLAAAGTAGGKGLSATGSGTSIGGKFSNGTAATGSTRHDSIQAFNGDIDMDNVANVNSSVTIKNRLTPSNIVKHWVSFTGGASPTVNDGYNVTSISCATNNYTVTIPQAFANSNYAVQCSVQGALGCVAYPASATTYTISCIASGGSQLNLCGGTPNSSCIAVGKQ